MNPMVDYYRILQVAPTARQDDIISAYRRLVKLYHPDVNADPMAEARMKDINQAYFVLRDEARRASYNSSRTLSRPAVQTPAPPRPATPSADAAVDAMNQYFRHLQTASYQRAYNMLCSFDRQYVTEASFVNWRRSVQKLFSVREFAVRKGEYVPRFDMEPGRSAPAHKLYISILEKNHASGVAERYQATKYAVQEEGEWRIFLGYRDLNEIARMFEDLSARHERGEMTRHWESYCNDTCRGLDMLSYTGLLKEAKRELYRCRRYGQAMTICCLSLNPSAPYNTEEAMADLLETAARALTASLRETDIAAYIGNGCFVVLFVELKTQHAESIIERLLGHVRQAVQREHRISIGTNYAYVPYGGEVLKTSIDRLLTSLQRR